MVVSLNFYDFNHFNFVILHLIQKIEHDIKTINKNEHKDTMEKFYFS